MLSEALKKDIILAIEHGDNSQDFLMNRPVPSEDIKEYQAFWQDVARITHIRPTPTSPSEEAPLTSETNVGWERGNRLISAP